MAVTSLQNNQFDFLLQQFKADFPVISFIRSTSTYWDPKNQTVHYNPDQKNPHWSLLHEIGHMESGHSSYNMDIQLLIMEKDAWSKAKVLSEKYNIPIDNDYIEDCLDSYRDWLHKRSLCPKCKQTGVQTDELLYYCVNCRQQWKVSISRFCRSYRRTI